MIIRAVVRTQLSKHQPKLQPGQSAIGANCERKVFLAKDTEYSHGTVKGPVRYYLIEGASWKHVRQTLKAINTMWYTNCNRNTVLSYELDKSRTTGGQGSVWSLTEEQVNANY